MIDQVSALFELGDRAPAVNYVYIEPTPQLVPDAALKKAHINENFFLAIVGLQNHSNRTLNTIVVKLPATPKHEPSFEFSKDSKRQATYVAEGPYVEISSLEPKASVYVTVFLTEPELTNFSEPQVLIDGKLLSKAMRTAGLVKAQPPTALLLGSSYAALAVSVAVLAYVISATSPLNPKVRALEASVSGWSSCTRSAYTQQEITPQVLARHKLGETLLLEMNKVPDRARLNMKDYVVICE